MSQMSYSLRPPIIPDRPNLAGPSTYHTSPQTNGYIPQQGLSSPGGQRYHSIHQHEGFQHGSYAPPPPRSSSYRHLNDGQTSPAPSIVQPQPRRLPLPPQHIDRTLVPTPIDSPSSGIAFPVPAPRQLDSTSYQIDRRGSLPEEYLAVSMASMNFPSSGSTASLNSPSSGLPSTHPFPTIESLSQAIATLDSSSDSSKLAWAEDVTRILDRRLISSGSSSDFTISQTNQTIKLPSSLNSLLNTAIPIIIALSSHPSAVIFSTACYLRGKLLASGACPDFLPRDPRLAFKDFEVAAKAGDPRGWFRLGRDYEGVGDMTRARDCFDRGKCKGDVECTYRMAMAYLLGQLGLSPDPNTALPLLRTAAELSTVDFPQPAYVYGMLLANELSVPYSIPSSLHLPSNAPPAQIAPQLATARSYIEKAAYLCHGPGQYKLGSLFEHAALGIPYDPLMSVQWYSLASQSGEMEADMALSKWFLCGAEGHFAKNEDLARTFAEKAARKGHPNGCFAMGYYFELGIGGPKDTEQAKKWYGRAAKLDNNDAVQRLAALNQPHPQAISIQEHQLRLNNTLVRRRTQARDRSDRDPQTRLQRRRQQEERLQIETVRAARAAARQDQLSPSSAGSNGIGNGGGDRRFMTSPNPQVRVPSPVPIHPAMIPPSTSFSRPPIPFAAFQTLPSTRNIQTPTNGLPRRPSEPHIRIPASPSRNNNRLSGQIDKRNYPLQDSLVPNLPEPSDLPIPPRNKGPQTFAEMGFVSKPVEEEGCIIM